MICALTQTQLVRQRFGTSTDRKRSALSFPPPSARGDPALGLMGPLSCVLLQIDPTVCGCRCGEPRLRGRRVRTRIVVRSNGTCTIDTVGHRKAAQRWLERLTGKKRLQVVGGYDA